jgi:hypothetical protein
LTFSGITLGDGDRGRWTIVPRFLPYFFRALRLRSLAVPHKSLRHTVRGTLDVAFFHWAVGTVELMRQFGD